MTILTFEDAMDAHRNASVQERQDLLMADYRQTPENALVTDFATTRGNGVSGGFALHTAVTPDKGELYPIGVHAAVGGKTISQRPAIYCAPQ